MEFQFGKEKEKLHIKVYNYYRDMINVGKLKPGQKLPSIRRCAEELGISRTTAENAYLQLSADGFVVPKPGSGYYVTDISVKKKETGKKSKTEENKDRIIYNFSSASADPDSFSFDLWRRYIKSALRQDTKLISYGEEQGEYELREALSQYLLNKRNAVCSAENIVVGAGVQSILHILCSVLGKRNVYFNGGYFGRGASIFSDHGWSIEESEENADVIYSTPSHPDTTGGIMNVNERIALIRNALENSKIIVEDDYDSEFAYSSRRIPSLQSLSSGHNTVYIGTLSRLLLPSIRLSFMILPDELLYRYNQIKINYNQTASKTEQIALSGFIRDGHLDRQIRKLRKLYSLKCKMLSEVLTEKLSYYLKVVDTESITHIKIKFTKEIDKEKLDKNLKINGVFIDLNNNILKENQFLLSCTSVKSDDFSDVSERILKSLKQSE